MARPRILCISLSPIERDARVLRQISVLAERGDVTTIGFGGPPPGASDHVRVPAGLATLPQTMSGVARLGLRMLRSAELAAPAIAWSLDALQGRRFDLVVVNEARALALADRVARGAPIWADLHEWAPEERTHVLSWRLLVAPLMRHLCTVYLPRVHAATTVSEPIAELYERAFGVRPQLMRNSAPWHDLEPSAVGGGEPGRIRLVHSGAAVHGRSLETTIDVVRSLDDRFTLDLFLVAANDGGAYLRRLEQRAAGDPRIQFRDPVAPRELAATLNDYDVGVFWIPPTHANARYTLPNKFFDYVQARLAIAIGPTEPMRRLVERHRLGVVSAGFTVDECRSSLLELDVASIASAKQHSHTAARELSFDTDADLARAIVDRLIGPDA